MTRLAVEVIAVTKRFASLCALDQINLEIRPGEFFSLLGPSGCGKTTLLRMIAGFENPSAGRILIDGAEVAGVPPHKRPVNMVFQSYALFPHLTIFENVAFGLRASRTVARQQIPERVEWALNLVRLQAMANRFPAQVSGGQAQRAALARAIVNQPRVLLLDEPLSALDLRIRQEMQEELSRLQRELGITFVMVTHDQGEALALSDRVAVFCQGRLEQVGTPVEIYERPESSFVADFIGQTNLLDGNVVEADGSGDYLRVQTAGKFQLWVRSGGKTAALDRGSDVTVWMRTDALKLNSGSAFQDAAGPPGGNQVNSFRAIVSSCNYQGATTSYRLQVDGSFFLTASCNNYPQVAFRLGEEVTVSVGANQVSILPASPVKAG